MKYFLLFILLFATTISCNQPDKDILSPDTMQQLILDVHFAEAYSTMVGDSAHKDRSKNMDSLIVYYKSILNHHHITEEQLIKSVTWYKRNPETLDSTYAAIIPKLSVLESVYADKK